MPINIQTTNSLNKWISKIMELVLCGRAESIDDDVEARLAVAAVEYGGGGDPFFFPSK